MFSSHFAKHRLARRAFHHHVSTRIRVAHLILLPRSVVGRLLKAGFSKEDDLHNIHHIDAKRRICNSWRIKALFDYRRQEDLMSLLSYPYRSSVFNRNFVFDNFRALFEFLLPEAKESVYQLWLTGHRFDVLVDYTPTTRAKTKKRRSCFVGQLHNYCRILKTNMLLKILPDLSPDLVWYFCSKVLKMRNSWDVSRVPFRYSALSKLFKTRPITQKLCRLLFGMTNLPNEFKSALVSVAKYPQDIVYGVIYAIFNDDFDLIPLLRQVRPVTSKIIYCALRKIYTEACCVLTRRFGEKYLTFLTQKKWETKATDLSRIIDKIFNN